MNLNSMLEKAYTDSKNNKETIKNAANDKLIKMKKDFIEFLGEKSEIYRTNNDPTWFNFQGKHYNFNIQLRDNGINVNVVMFVFDNSFGINRATLFYEIDSAEKLNESFENWIISNSMKYLFME